MVISFDNINWEPDLPFGIFKKNPLRCNRRSYRIYQHFYIGKFLSSRLGGKRDPKSGWKSRRLSGELTCFTELSTEPFLADAYIFFAGSSIETQHSTLIAWNGNFVSRVLKHIPYPDLYDLTSEAKVHIKRMFFQVSGICCKSDL